MDGSPFDIRQPKNEKMTHLWNGIREETKRLPNVINYTDYETA